MALVIDFLEAADGTPLTKSFTQTDTGFDVAPYPFVRVFNSYREQVDDVRQLHTALTYHAARGRCLIKGVLKQQLANQSRQGMTDAAAPSNLLVLDLDFEEGWNSVDDFLNAIGLGATSYVFQHSASAGIKYKPGLRGHVFMLTTQPVLPALFKAWLKSVNLCTASLINQMTLSANGLSLRWPLDITVCQNDKIIYIAPPRCQNFEDPLDEQRFMLAEHANPAAQLDFVRATSPGQLDTQVEMRIAQLRAIAGYREAKPKFRTKGDFEYLSNPTQAAVTGVRIQRGFVYINLNGGDSYAYWFPEDNPEFLYNFKGEPPVKLKAIAPEFYQEYAASQRRGNVVAQEVVPIVFRDRERDCYYNVLVHPDQRVEYAKVSNVLKMNHFMLQHGGTPPDVIPDWRVLFDPSSLEALSTERRELNTFEPTPYLRNTVADAGAIVPRTIRKLLLSIHGDSSEAVEHFLDWLAYIFQTRRKTGTSWVWTVVHGTGKGAFISKVIRPIFGNSHVHETLGAAFDDAFNAPLERALFLYCDEFDYRDCRRPEATMNKLKNLITEPRIAIRGMRQDAVMADSYTNVIIASNNPAPVHLAPTDRRFNIPPAQERPIKVVDGEIEGIDNELPEFAAFLAARATSAEKARTILMSDARQTMITASLTSVDNLFAALRSGDLDFFIRFVCSQPSTYDPIQHQYFSNLVRRWADDIRSSRTTTLDLTEVQTVYGYVLSARIAPAKLLRMYSLHRVAVTGANTIVLAWHASPEALSSLNSAAPENHNVVTMRSANAHST